MLLGEHGRGREYRHLFAVHDRLERGANGDFGFAKAGIAANQAVHRPRLLHVDFCFDDCFQLVRCFAKWKRMLKLGLPFRVGTKRVAGMRFALSLEGEHFARVVENGGRGVFLRARPFCVAKRTEWRRLFADTDVAGNEIGLFKRHIKFRFIGKLEDQNFLRSVLRREFFKTEEPSDAVFEMDNEVALTQLTEINLRAMAFCAPQAPAAMRGESPE